ncbi:MAG TPA: ABC transporter ATP-binding protein [Solirubrobacteraceae bacterium]|nr:ABC transporter ATP-binding protein [Solirubrobacteraceae bacterium]
MSAPAGAEVRVEGVAKSFGGVGALRDVSLDVPAGEAVAITGRSGSGKSTLLALIGGLEQPDRGRVLIDGRAIWKRADVARARRELVGFVFQRHLLLEALSARTNVEVPLIGAGVRRAERRRRALELLGEVGLAERAEHLPSELSGGERQRVAVARALVNQPRLLLADEPTGALDSHTSERVLDLLFRLRDQHGTTMIVVSYDAAVGARADRTVTLLDGALAGDDARAGAGAPAAALSTGDADGAPGGTSSTGAGSGDGAPADSSSTGASSGDGAPAGTSSTVGG